MWTRGMGTFGISFMFLTNPILLPINQSINWSIHAMSQIWKRYNPQQDDWTWPFTTPHRIPKPIPTVLPTTNRKWLTLRLRNGLNLTNLFLHLPTPDPSIPVGTDENVGSGRPGHAGYSITSCLGHVVVRSIRCGSICECHAMLLLSSECVWVVWLCYGYVCECVRENEGLVDGWMRIAGFCCVVWMAGS